MFDLKPISHDSVAGALAKAERYRLLNEPNEAESICRDILEIEPGNQAGPGQSHPGADRPDSARRHAFADALATVVAPATRPTTAPTTPASRGSAGPRRATAAAATAPSARLRMDRQGPASYSRQPSRSAPRGNDDALLRWNACVRFLNHHRELAPAVEDIAEPIISE